MSVQYSCAHLDDPEPPLPPSYPSSSSTFQPLPNLYFCEECDAVRCNLCSAVEIASYFCPNCLFDVPSANVRADRNRSAVISGVWRKEAEETGAQGIASRARLARAVWQSSRLNDILIMVPSNRAHHMFLDVQDVNGLVERSDGSLRNPPV